MSGIRVISGKAKGRKLARVPGDITRPISDRVKESLFNILGGEIFDSAFLDLFAGTGSVGIEALSRGSSYVRFLDNHHRAIQTIQANLEATALDTNAEVLQMDAFTHLARPADRSFDYLFIAPPQYKGMWEQAVILASDHLDWLVEDAWVIAQIDPKEYKTLEVPNLVEFDRRQYGSTMLVFFEQHK